MYKEKIEKLIAQLSCGLYERDECLKLLLLSMFAGKSIFLFGPPGTAKSMIARRASEAFKVDDSENKFFDYLMNRFSTPEEIFGPIDIAELKKNNLKRQTQGYLPNAHFAFLDEIWKSSPAILNTLLTIINERIYKSGKDRIKVPLKGLVCASNEFPPENQGLEALYDRMIVRYFVGPLEDVENFEKLLFDNTSEFDNTNIDAFSIDQLALIQKNSKNIPFSDAAKKLIRAIKYKLEELRAEKNQQAKDVPYVSDRRWKNCVELLRVAAFLGDKNEVDISDISLLRHVLWEKDTQREFIYKIIEDCILMFSVEDNSRIKEIQEDFQRLDQLCEKEAKLIYKRLAYGISNDAQTLINNLENTLTKITTNANPFITKNDINLSFAPLANNIKELNNIILGVEELVETKLNENFIKQQEHRKHNCSVGKAGEQGFGVCECPDIDSLPWINAIPGHNEKSSENYGNYQTLNGSVMVCIPKFFYRWGHSQSPNYAKYGANALDIVGADVFSNESEANAAGYALHRAFIDNGQEQPYFFIDKYLCSKDGNNSCKSVKNGNPISLTYSTGYNPSNGMTGCTGIYADAVVLARARGATFNCMSIFQQNAIAMLSLAHGQAATSPNYCAWYDAAGTKNYPKGCNNGSLADCDDTSVRFTSAGNSGTSAKPQAGSGNPFAKTTHNGQACGVADINGSLFQVMLGITNAGTSATDTTQNKTNNAYVWKRSTKFSTITGGFGGDFDAWGTASSLAKNYDFVTGIFNNYAMVSQRVGNGTNGVFSSAVSGTDWLKTCCGITTSNGYSSNGTNTFGVDYYYEYSYANMFPLASYHWNVVTDAGVWSRDFGHSRYDGGNAVGFRAAAYKN